MKYIGKKIILGISLLLTTSVFITVAAEKSLANIKADEYSDLGKCPIQISSDSDISLELHIEVRNQLINKLKRTCNRLTKASDTFSIVIDLMKHTEDQSVRGKAFGDGDIWQGSIYITSDQVDELVRFLKKNHLNGELRQDITNKEIQIKKHGIKVIRSLGTNKTRANLTEYRNALVELADSLRSYENRYLSIPKGMRVNITHETSWPDIDPTEGKHGINIGHESISEFLALFK